MKLNIEDGHDTGSQDSSCLHGVYGAANGIAAALKMAARIILKSLDGAVSTLKDKGGIGGMRALFFIAPLHPTR
jgi:hypothetical protein